MRSDNNLQQILHRTNYQNSQLLSDLHKMMYRDQTRYSRTLTTQSGASKESGKPKLLQTLPDLMSKLQTSCSQKQFSEAIPNAENKRVRHTSMMDDQLVFLMKQANNRELGSGHKQVRNHSANQMNKDSRMFLSQHTQNSSLHSHQESEEDLRNQVIKLKLENKSLNNQVLKLQILSCQKFNKYTQCDIKVDESLNTSLMMPTQEQLQGEKQKVSLLESKLAAEEHRCLKLEKELMILRLGNSQLSTQLNLMESEIEYKTSQHHLYEEETKQAHSLIRSSHQETDSLRKRLSQSQQELINKEAARKKLESERIHMQIMIKELRDQLKEATTKPTLQFSDVEVQCQLESEQYQKLKDEILYISATTQEEIRSLNEQLRLQNKLLDEQEVSYNQQFMESKKNIESLRKELSIQRDQYNECLSNAKQLELDIASLKSSNESKIKELNLVKKQNSLIKSENTALKGRIQQQQIQFEKEVKEFNRNIAECQEKHRNDLEKFKVVIDKQSAHSDTASELTQLRSFKISQAITLETLDREHQELQYLYSRQCDELKELHVILNRKPDSCESSTQTRANSFHIEKLVNRSIQYDGNKSVQEELKQTKQLLKATQSEQENLKEQLFSMQRELDTQNIEKELNVSNIHVTKQFGFDDNSEDGHHAQTEDHTLMVHQLINLQIQNEQYISLIDELKQELEERELNENKLILKIRNLSGQLQEKEIRRTQSISPQKTLHT